MWLLRGRRRTCFVSSYGPVGRSELLTPGIVVHSGGSRRHQLCFRQPAQRFRNRYNVFLITALTISTKFGINQVKGGPSCPPCPSEVSLHLVTRLPFPSSLCPSAKLVGGDLQPGCPKATGDLKLCPMRRRGEKRHYYAE